MKKCLGTCIMDYLQNKEVSYIIKDCHIMQSLQGILSGALRLNIMVQV